MKCIDYPENQLKNGKVYHVYDPNVHTYFPAKYCKKTGYFDTQMDRCTNAICAGLPVQTHYSAIGREFLMEKDVYKKACPEYVVVRDPEGYIPQLTHSKVFNLKQGESFCIGQHTITRSDFLPYRFEVKICGQVPTFYDDAEKVFDFLMQEYIPF